MGQPRAVLLAVAWFALRQNERQGHVFLCYLTIGPEKGSLGKYSERLRRVLLEGYVVLCGQLNVLDVFLLAVLNEPVTLFPTNERYERYLKESSDGLFS